MRVLVGRDGFAATRPHTGGGTIRRLLLRGIVLRHRGPVFRRLFLLGFDLACVRGRTAKRLEVVDQLGRGLVALLGMLRHEPIEDGLDLLGGSNALMRQRNRLLHLVFEQHLRQLAGDEGWLTGQ